MLSHYNLIFNSGNDYVSRLLTTFDGPGSDLVSILYVPIRNFFQNKSSLKNIWTKADDSKREFYFTLVKERRNP